MTQTIYRFVQVTLIGWLPATIWAVYTLGQFKTDEKIKKAIAQVNDSRKNS